MRQTWNTSSLDETNNKYIEIKRETHSKPVFSLGLVWGATDDLLLRGLFSQGYRLPTLQQLYNGTVHGGATPTLPNPSLDPETSDNFEIGQPYEFQNLSLDLTGLCAIAQEYITTRTEGVAKGLMI